MIAKIPHPGFARRLAQACDGNSDIPPLNFGRLNWFVSQLEKQDVEVGIEAVRKWFAGETRPRYKALAALARVLKVDEGWLVTGKSPEFTEREKKLHNVAANGAVNIVAGFIQMHGGHPAFPAEDDREAYSNHVDLYAIIRGAKYSFHVVIPLNGQESDQKFLIPSEAEGTIILGVVGAGSFSVRIFEIDWDTIHRIGVKKNDGYHVSVSGAEWREITSFAERI